MFNGMTKILSFAKKNLLVLSVGVKKLMSGSMSRNAFFGSTIFGLHAMSYYILT